MDKETLDRLSTWFESYAMSYADANGKLSKAAECKLVHTREVKAASARIASSEYGAALSGSLALLAECGGLLHDVARFEQYKLHKTFSDAKSFDHGEAGSRIVNSLKLLSMLPEHEADWVVKAIQLHNKPLLPKGLALEGEVIAKVVRDADKVAILQFIARYLNEEAEYWRDPAISLDMPDTGSYTESVLRTAASGTLVLYREVRCVNDFLISLFAWPNDINYAESARMILEQDLYGRIGRHLPCTPEICEFKKATISRLEKIARRT